MKIIMYFHPDFHMHSSSSDGSDSPLALLEKVRQTDIDIFSLTDHDTYLGCQQLQAHLLPQDPVFLGGIELSCQDETGKYHILGYCYNANKRSIYQAVQLTHNSRREKAQNRLRFLQEVHQFSFTQEEINHLMQNENPGKPHFVSLLMQKGYISDKAEGFALLGEYHGKERKLTPEQAIDAILRADGIPVLAHGILADGTKQLTEEQITARVKRLKDFGLMGLEGYYSSYSAEQTAIMLSLAEKNNLMVTAGSDYHGKQKAVRLGDSGNPDPARMERFYRAAKQLFQ